MKISHIVIFPKHHEVSRRLYAVQNLWLSIFFMLMYTTTKHQDSWHWQNLICVDLSPLDYWCIKQGCFTFFLLNIGKSNSSVSESIWFSASLKHNRHKQNLFLVFCSKELVFSPTTNPESIKYRAEKEDTQLSVLASAFQMNVQRVWSTAAYLSSIKQ